MVKQLGSLQSSEELLQEIYIYLRNKINEWAKITHQTAQARMGYVGQHLVSVVTGYPGGKSGARGKDLILNSNEYAEIKTCYRVDQLGQCNNCNAVVASIEDVCSSCGSTDIKRKEDSKWLITIRNEEEFDKILEPKYYYLVLFDWINLDKQEDEQRLIRVSIWQVNTLTLGFAYAMIDYYFNIRKFKPNAAPFDFWPFSLKFDLMQGYLVYRSYIDSKNNITTKLFPGRDQPYQHFPKTLQRYYKSNNLTKDKLLRLANCLDISTKKSIKKDKLISILDQKITEQGGFNQQVTELVTRILYWEQIKDHIKSLPTKLRDTLSNNNLI